MIDTERGIHPQQVPGDVYLVTSTNDFSKSVTVDHPARDVMTDLTAVTPFQIESSASMEDVNNKMIACGVRLLFVNDHLGNFTGIITSTDILGEKPLLFIKDNGGSREDISAEDLMTPLNKLEAIPFDQVLRSHVGDVVTALKDCRRHHMLVLEERLDRNYVRGLFSVTQVSKQLGTKITPNERAEGLAQLNKALG